MGMGWVLSRVTVVCSACLGAGEVQGKKCSSCAGSGDANVETEILCDRCQGDGITSDYLSDSTPYG
jgi:DnaJ-class molecular chaperone